jgi:biotin synthase
VGNKVYFRGLIELSNICGKDCYYCGIRKSNPKVARYRMPDDEIVEAAIWAYHEGYGSIVLQAGEIQGDKFTDDIEQIIRKIKSETKGELGITLSLGEQNDSTYMRWYDAGAHRYLLRIETSDSDLYSTLHPSDHDYEKRKTCLYALKRIGYYVGTGVMIGLPGQTVENCADDILFFRDLDVDMIGMGPYIPHNDTPLGAPSDISGFDGSEQLEKALMMIAVTRIVLKDVNIASTTALQALNDLGREMGLKAGANIIMPNITDTRYRRGYQLYENKPCLDENASMCRGCLESRIQSIGETIGYHEWGDSPHFNVRTGK